MVDGIKSAGSVQGVRTNEKGAAQKADETSKKSENSGIVRDELLLSDDALNLVNAQKTRTILENHLDTALSGDQENLKGFLS